MPSTEVPDISPTTIMLAALAVSGFGSRVSAHSWSTRHLRPDTRHPPEQRERAAGQAIGATDLTGDTGGRRRAGFLGVHEPFPHTRVLAARFGQREHQVFVERVHQYEQSVV